MSRFVTYWECWFTYYDKKKKRRQGYTKMRGHRQRYTEILIDTVAA